MHDIVVELHLGRQALVAYVALIGCIAPLQPLLPYDDIKPAAARHFAHRTSLARLETPSSLPLR